MFGVKKQTPRRCAHPCPLRAVHRARAFPANLHGRLMPSSAPQNRTREASSSPSPLPSRSPRSSTYNSIRRFFKAFPHRHVPRKCANNRLKTPQIRSARLVADVAASLVARWTLSKSAHLSPIDPSFVPHRLPRWPCSRRVARALRSPHVLQRFSRVAQQLRSFQHMSCFRSFCSPRASSSAWRSSTIAASSAATSSLAATSSWPVQAPTLRVSRALSSRAP